MKKWNVGWGFTKLCNSKCKHCYNASGTRDVKELNLSQAKLVVDKLKENNIQTINYGTGECGLVLEFWNLVTYVHSKNIIQGLTTNGSTINNDTIKMIKKYMNDVDVSLDFPTKEENNDFRGHNKAWDWAMNAIELLKKNEIDFSIVTCLTAENSNFKTIDYFLNLSKKYNCDWRINWFRPTGRGKFNDYLKLDPKKVHEIFRYIVENAIIKALPDPYFSSLINLNSRKGCPCGKESFRITPLGEVVPCVYFTNEIKNVSILDNSFENILSSNAMQKINNRTLDFCKDCEYFDGCIGGCTSRAYLEHKTMDSPDAFCFKKFTDTNPLKDLKYEYDPSGLKVHDNYLCTFIVKAKS